MSLFDASHPTRSSSLGVPCAYSWCTTAHGTTVHPDDEDHRSAGVFISGIVRGDDSAEYEADFEVGLLRRHDESDTWLVIDQGDQTRLVILLDSARRAIKLLHDDSELSMALGLGQRDEPLDR